MVSLEDDLRDLIEIKYSHQSNCDITGDTISDMEPHIYVIVEDIRISKNGASGLVENFDETIKESDSLYIYPGYSCDFCGSNVESRSILYEQSHVFNICDLCTELFNSILREKLKEIDSNHLYYDESGFVVSYYSSNELFSRVGAISVIEKSNFFVRIGFDGKYDNKDFVDVSNLENFIKTLREASSVCIDSKTNCDLCREFTMNFYPLGKEDYSDVFVCEECINSFLDSIEKFYTENEYLIVSKMI